MLLMENIDRKKLKKEFVSLSKFLEYDKYYPKEFTEFCSSYPEDKLSISSSIYWYTNPSFVFRIVYSVLRANNDPFCLRYIHLLLQDLCNSIKILHQKQKINHEFDEDLVLYRRTEISENEKVYFEINVSKMIELSGFISTTRNIKKT